MLLSEIQFCYLKKFPETFYIHKTRSKFEKSKLKFSIFLKRNKKKIFFDIDYILRHEAITIEG